MAYQNVGTPRFYIDIYQDLKSNGIDVGKWYNDHYGGALQTNNYEENSNYGGNGYDFTPLKYPQVFDLHPTEQFFFSRDEGEGSDNAKWFNFAMPFPMIKCENHQKVYAFILNHSLYDESLLGYNGVENSPLGMYINFQRKVHEEGGSYSDEEGDYNIHSDSAQNRIGVLNCDSSSPYLIYNNGFSLMLADPIYDEEYSFFRIGIRYDGSVENNTIGHHIGGISYGFYYDMPHSPELDLTMTIENDGYSSITTQGGAHLSDVSYLGAPMWKREDGIELPPWTIGGNTLETRNGRRVWSLSFNYLSDSDLFASNYMSTTYLESGSDTGYDSDDIDDDNFYYTLENDNSFHAQVLNKIGNGQRFIFQPDNTNNQPDQFAICQLNQDSLEVDQIANGVYNIRMEIREVW